MKKVLFTLTMAVALTAAFANPAGANSDRPGATPPPDQTTTTTVLPAPPTTVPTPQTTVPPAPPTTVPTPPTAEPPAPPVVATPQSETPSPRATPGAQPPVAIVRQAEVPAPVAKPSASAAIDCASGVVFNLGNTGDAPAVLTLVVNDIVVTDVTVAAGGTETYVFNLPPAAAGTTVAVKVLHGDVTLSDGELAVGCGQLAATPCVEQPAAGTPAIGTVDTGCTSPCWWAPAALAAGVLLGRRRRNGRYNYAGIAAGLVGAIAALMRGDASPALWVGAAAAVAGIAAIMWVLNRRDDQVEADADDSEVSETSDETDEHDHAGTGPAESEVI